MVAVVPFQAFAYSSRGGIPERHVQCVQSLMHLAESATIWQQLVALFSEHWEQKLINNFNYCLQQHYH